MNSNTGGRVDFSVDENVRIIDVDGRVTQKDYAICQARSDRRGQLQLIHRSTGKIRKVHHRRILPHDYQDGMAVVLETNNRYYALCPLCGFGEEISNHEHCDCKKCGELQLYWLSNKPDIIKKSKPRISKVPSMPSKPTVIDLYKLSKIEKCELWTKKNVSFDHERIDVRSHILIYNDEENPRKYCFNTYNGTLGKKAKKLHIEEFIADEPIDSKKHWFSIGDMAKTKEKLAKDGYDPS